MPLVSEFAQRFRDEVARAIVGQQDVVEQLLVGILADGHILLEGVPGVAKTLAVRTTAALLDLHYSRVQFTPDLMPSDLIGTNVYDPKSSEFKLRQGPVFTNVLLADEINRTPPKTQAALLEAMEERQVTIDGERYALPNPFIVFATQNPIEFEGTYPLPEAQQDRFLLKVQVDYPEPDSEIEVLRRTNTGFSAQNLGAMGLPRILAGSELADLRSQVQDIDVQDDMLRYIYGIVSQTRTSRDVLHGASPRAGIALVRASKAHAALYGRNYVTPDDIKALAPAVLRHRLILRPEAEIEGLTVERVLAGILDLQVVPR